MATIVVSNIKTVDPGFSFNLTLNADGGGPINKSVKVEVTLTGPNGTQYASSVKVKNPVSDQTITIVVPFGDSSYTPGSMMQYSIQVFVPENSSKADATFTGAVIAASGGFQISSNLPVTAQQLTDNQMINSVDDNYIGIMQTDGNFCVYQKYTPNAQQPVCTDASNSSGSIANYKIWVEYTPGSDVRVFIQNTDNGTIVAQNNPVALPFSGPSYYLIVNAQGQICVGIDPTNPSAYQAISWES